MAGSADRNIYQNQGDGTRRGTRRNIKILLKFYLKSAAQGIQVHKKRRVYNPRRRIYYASTKNRVPIAIKKLRHAEPEK
jgi:hypothetical protein